MSSWCGILLSTETASPSPLPWVNRLQYSFIDGMKWQVTVSRPVFLTFNYTELIKFLISYTEETRKRRENFMTY